MPRGRPGIRAPDGLFGGLLSVALRRARPSALLPAALVVPLLGLALGFAWPATGLAVREGLGAVVPLLLFSATASAEFGRPTRAEIGAAARLLLAACVAAPVLVALLALGADLPSDLALGAVLAAAGPVSIGSSVVARRFGMAERPVIWAAVVGLVLSPFLVPLAVAVGGWGGPPPGDLARRAALVVAGPVGAAFLLRRVAPGAIGAAVDDLRGLVVLALGLLACAAGGKAMVALGTGGVSAPAVAAGTLVVAVGAAWVVGAAGGGSEGGSRGGRALATGSCLRNTSVIWTAALAAGGLPPRAEAVMVLFLAATFLVTFGLLLAARGRVAVGRVTGG